MAALPCQLTELVDDAIAEILLRVPPKEPAHLVRASLVCKPWRRVLTDPAFLLRYRRFHGAPPLLGFYTDILSAAHVPRFVPTTATACPFSSSASLDCWALDCRHGRVLFFNTDDIHNHKFLVWYPMTGAREEVPVPSIRCWSAAVLCATADCDHSSCHGGGPFLVVGVGFDVVNWHAHVCVYSSQAGAWVPSVHLDVGVHRGHLNHLSLPVIVGDGVYLALELNDRIAILKYDLGRHHLSIFALLPSSLIDNLLIMPTEDSLLGFASIKDSRLCLRSRIVSGDAAPRWVTYRVIDLQKVLPVTIPINKAKVIGFAEGVNVIFLATEVGTFIIDLKSERSRKVSEHCINRHAIPLMSYYTPGNWCIAWPKAMAAIRKLQDHDVAAVDGFQKGFLTRTWPLWMAFRSAEATECRAADAILALICPRLGMCLLALPAPRDPPPLLHGTAMAAPPAAAAAAAWLVIFGKWKRRRRRQPSYTEAEADDEALMILEA